MATKEEKTRRVEKVSSLVLLDQSQKEDFKLTPLFLSTTQTSLPNLCIHPIRKSPNEITIRLSRSNFDLLLRRSRGSVGDVFSNGSVEERRILRNDTELVTPGGGGEVADV